MAKGSKQLFREAFEREHATSMRVLRAFPDDKSDFKPQEKAKTARDVVWPLVLGQERLMVKALTTGFDWSKPPSDKPGPPPATLSGVADRLEKAHAQALEALEAVEESALENETVQFFVGPKKLGDIPKLEFLWYLLFDHVHHRGQFSTYHHAAGAKLPSIYGPSADEPWN
jgi:uncharacterized damage-inducible protein DinB